MIGVRKKIFIAVVVMVAVGGYLAYSGARSSMAYYLTVGELLDGSAAVQDSDLRVSGKVAVGSVRWDQVSGLLQFEATDGSRALRVVYRGVVPDTFKPGADVVVEGRFDGTTFTAVRLFAKCPSKFEVKDG
jgi:cytochrome c-type biogenesis protein CcmE